jgi:DNA-binding Xre family transcriptional regulator
MISYKPLEHTLVDRGINKAELGRRCKLSPSTLSKFSRGESLTLTVIERVCLELDCRIEEVVEILKD